MFVQAVSTPTPCVKEICCFATLAGCKPSTPSFCGWKTLRRFSEQRVKSTSNVGHLFSSWNYNSSLQWSVCRLRRVNRGGEDGHALLLWKVFPSISCSPSECCHGWLTGRRRHRQRGRLPAQGRGSPVGGCESLPPAAPPPPTTWASFGLQNQRSGSKLHFTCRCYCDSLLEQGNTPSL